MVLREQRKACDQQFMAEFAQQGFLRSSSQRSMPWLGELVWDDERWWKTAGMVASNGVARDFPTIGLEIADWVGWNRLSFNNFIILDVADMRPVPDNNIALQHL
jgi:hypothetical protein